MSTDTCMHKESPPKPKERKAEGLKQSLNVSPIFLPWDIAGEENPVAAPVLMMLSLNNMEVVHIGLLWLLYQENIIINKKWGCYDAVNMNWSLFLVTSFK
jgi:hypothetical protein